MEPGLAQWSCFVDLVMSFGSDELHEFFISSAHALAERTNATQDLPKLAHLRLTHLNLEPPFFLLLLSSMGRTTVTKPISGRIHQALPNRRRPDGRLQVLSLGGKLRRRTTSCFLF
jgi:hypothetical protein